MQRDRSAFFFDNNGEPCPETKAIRPDIGLDRRQRAKASAKIKTLMRARLDQLPDGAALTDADKEPIYAQAAQAMSAALKRPVGLDQIRLVAATIRTPNSLRRNHSTSLTPRHYARLRADAEAEGVSMAEITRRILDLHYEMPPER